MSSSDIASLSSAVAERGFTKISMAFEIED
jgi:hypothetical protein